MGLLFVSVLQFINVAFNNYDACDLFALIGRTGRWSLNPIYESANMNLISYNYVSKVLELL